MKKTGFYLLIIIPVIILHTSFYGLIQDTNEKVLTDGQMTAKFDAQRQVMLAEDEEPILRYNYEIVYEDDKYAFNGLDANEYIKTETDTFMANPSIYAVPRSNYIHPIFGLNGEILTRDWSKDHPHHRGIYWAWPEVDFARERNDLHALQKVFARPTGRIKLTSRSNYAQVEAENVWITEKDVHTIVREITLIRAYAMTDNYRVIDLAYWFEGLKDRVTIARRGTDLYGGLNIRMMTPESQEISYHIDEKKSSPRRAWSDLSGVFANQNDASGMTVFQHKDNPEYPGAWVEYPELSWVQPTFPTAGTRYPLRRGEPLVLRFRIIVHNGGMPAEEQLKMLWDQYHENVQGIPDFTL